MRNFFPFLLVILGILLNRRALCLWIDCKDIYNNTALLRLKEYLFCYYDAENKPTEKFKNATLVTFGLSIYHYQVNELTRSVDFNVLVRLAWTDPHLTWKPSDFDNIELLRAMSDEIWNPDIVMHSTTTMDIDMEMQRVECWVYHQGTIFCVPSAVYSPVCEADYTWWPYDVMNCTIHIASWSHSDNEIDLRFAESQVNSLIADEANGSNSEWELIHVFQSERTVDSKFGLDFTSNMLSYRIQLKRYSAMYSVIYITLAIVLMTMTLMVLWLEASSTERMIIANLNFVLHLACLQDLHWRLPFNGSRPPEILFFYENSLILAAFSLILTSILRYVQELSAEAPAWISSTTVSILRSRVGQVLLVSILDPKVSARIEMNAEDNANLVSFDKKDSSWRYTSILIGWLAFLGVFLVYVIMLLVFLPINRSVGVSSLSA